jgi:copper transport protein
VLGVLVVMAFRLRGRTPTLGTTASAAALAAALATAEALGSHAAALRPSSTPVPADAAHVLSASVWMGAVAALILALWPTPGFTIRDAATLAVGIRRRFAVLAGAGAVIVAITGLYAAGRQVASVDALLLTLYGRTLLAKTAVVALAGVFGACNFLLLRQLATGGRRRLVRASIVAEATVGGAAFLAAGVLTAAAPARGPSFAPPRPVVPVTLSRQVDDLILTVTVRPNRPGTNTIGIEAASTRRPPPAPIDALRFRLGSSSGTAAFPRSVGGGGWLTPAALERPGDERIDVIVTRGGHRLVVPFGWRVDPTDPARRVVVSSRRLSPIVNRAALLLLVAAPICAALALAAARPARSRPRAAPDSASRLEGFS